jgi:hypothetical protein
MGTSYFSSARERKDYMAEMAKQADARNAKEAARIKDERDKLAAKIVMAVVDKIVKDIIRPGPDPEERECYEMAGEVRAIVPDLEKLAKRIIDANDGVE